MAYLRSTHVAGDLSVSGNLKANLSIKIAGVTKTLDGSRILEWTADDLVLRSATAADAGVVKLGSDTVQTVAANAVTATASRSYAVQKNSSGQMVVNVPWTDANTVYTHPSGDGNLHVPATGTANNGKFLMAGATAGSLSWSALPVATTSIAGIMTAADKTKLDGIAAGAQVNSVTSVAGKTGAVTLAKGDVGLSNVDNIQQAPIARKISAGTGLSGGGDLTADRTLSVSYGTTAGTAAQGNDSRITNALRRDVPNTSGYLALGSAQASPGGVDRSIEIATNTAFGGEYNNHTGVRLVSYMPGSWGTGKFGVQIATNWGEYGPVNEVLHSGNILQATGTSTEFPMSQKATTDALNTKAASSHTHDYVPTSRTVNNKALSANISLTAADVGAAASSHGHTAATTSADGFMSAADKSKLNGIASGANAYSLPAASSGALGGIKVSLSGTTLTIST